MRMSSAVEQKRIFKFLIFQSTDNMFEPLKETVELLTVYEVEIDETVHKQFEELPEQWETTKKKVKCSQID